MYRTCASSSSRLECSLSAAKAVGANAMTTVKTMADAITRANVFMVNLLSK
jgi:hypothetical protein